jgi:1,4-alpha-glucan branching enzyme
VALATHQHHLGAKPRGIWAPECGYRPAGLWSYPVAPAGEDAPPQPFRRIGVEQALSESGLEFFFVDTHLVQESAEVFSPYDFMLRPTASRGEAAQTPADRRLYHPFYVEGPYDRRFAATIFPRDPRTGLQVWSGDSGYPGDEHYLDFHKKRWPGGHRYWRVTGPRIDIGDKQPYIAAEAAERVREHAAHFVQLVLEALGPSLDDGIPPVLCSPFDAELFGHWWFEGIQWLEAVARRLHEHPGGLSLISGSAYLDRYPRAGSLALHEGSWGAEGTNKVWLNPETSWTYAHLYAAELACRDVCTAGRWRDGGLGERIVQQLCRELLLLESSDWQFLITTGAARDYAELRFNTHREQFDELLAMWRDFERSSALSQEQIDSLQAIEERDSIFASIDPGLWALGAHAVPPGVDSIGNPGNSAHAAGPQAQPSVADGSISEIPKYLPPMSLLLEGDADESR